jgi:ribonuclease P protein subunit POP4
MITPENLVRHELIGLRVRILESSNKTNLGLTGKVVDETRNMIVIEKPDGTLARIAKETSVFSFEVGRVWVKVDGHVLVGRPEDRIKKKLRTW